MAESRSSSVSCPQDGSPLDRLARAPYRFDFFQAVRLLAWAAHDADSVKCTACRPVGYDFPPRDEIVRFRSEPSFSFPAATIHNLRRPADDPQGPPEMEVTFMGLFGPNGVLPRHYTQLIIDRSRQRDFSLRDFLDLFNHRAISLFWRAWAKPRLPIAFEESQRAGRTEDLFTTILYSLVGLTVQATRRRMEIRDPAFLFYAGHYARVAPQAITLEGIVTSYFSTTAAVEQFRGQWLRLDPADQTRLGGSRLGKVQAASPNNCLGQTAVVGQRVWSVENRFRIRLGPLTYEQFESFAPNGPLQLPLAQLVRTYVGPEYDFDIQLVLRRDEVPATRLASRDQPSSSRLGWNSWIFSRPLTNDAEDAAFHCEGSPTRG